jgi:hypothetical protein
LVKLAELSGRTWTVIVALAPLASAPIVQVWLACFAHDPWDEWLDSSVSPLGSASMTFTPLAVVGPWSVTVSF